MTTPGHQHKIYCDSECRTKGTAVQKAKRQRERIKRKRLERKAAKK